TVEFLEVRTTPSCTIAGTNPLTITCNAMGDTATIDHDDVNSMAVLTINGAAPVNVPDSSYTRILYLSTVENTTVNILSNVKPVNTNSTAPFGGGRTATVNVGNGGFMAGEKGAPPHPPKPPPKQGTPPPSSPPPPPSPHQHSGPRRPP